jgi:hypothetical protein
LIEEEADMQQDGDNNPVYAAFSQAVRKVTGWPMQLVRGLGPTILPRPERLYFWFGAPIDTSRFAGAHEDDDAARTVRDEVRHAVEDGIAFLLDERERDPHRGLVSRLRGRAER